MNGILFHLFLLQNIFANCIITHARTANTVKVSIPKKRILVQSKKKH